jgi:hypothetical protein
MWISLRHTLLHLHAYSVDRGPKQFALATINIYLSNICEHFSSQLWSKQIIRGGPWFNTQLLFIQN